MPLTVSFLRCGAARVVVDEERRMKGEIELRHGSTIRKERYNEAGKWALARDPELSESASLVTDTAAGYTKVSYGPDGRFAAIIRHTPFEVQFQRDGETHVKLNDRGLLNVEQWRAKVDPPDGDGGEDQSTWWDETFGGQTDSKPRGPESVGLDIAFPGYDHVFGIPEHADSISLKETRYCF